MKTALFNFFINSLLLTVLGVSCLNMLSWEFFIRYKEYLVLVFILINGLMIILNAMRSIKNNLIIFSLAIISIVGYMSANAYYVRTSIQEMGSCLLLINLFLTWINFSSLYVSEKQRHFFVSFLSIYGVIFLIKNWNNALYNSNTLATFSFPLLVYMYIYIKQFAQKNFIAPFLFSLFFYFAYKYECRSVLIGEIIFVVLLLNHTWIKLLWFKCFVVLLFVSSILLPIAWTRVWLSGFSLSLPLIKKSLYSGRESVWSAFLDYFYENPLWGTGNGVLPIPFMEYRTYTPHNFLFCLLVVYGIFVFIIALFILYRILLQQRAVASENETSRIGLAGLCAILVTSFFEIIPLSYIHVNIVWFLLVIGNIDDKKMSINLEKIKR